MTRKARNAVVCSDENSNEHSVEHFINERQEDFDSINSNLIHLLLHLTQDSRS